MMSCEDVRNLVEPYVAETLDAPRRRAVAVHLQECQECRHLVEDARLADLLLARTDTPPAPTILASNIKSAARTHLTYRPRPIHERALGSPAFMATCASLFCGAVICLVAILRVGSVPSEPVPPQLARAPVVLGSLVTVQPREAVAHRTPAVRSVAAVHRELAPVAARPAPRRVAIVRARAVRPSVQRAPRQVGRPREARPARVLTARAVTRTEGPACIPVSYVAPARQRTSLPGSIQHTPASLIEPVRPGSGDADVAPADRSLTTFDLAGPPPPRACPRRHPRGRLMRQRPWPPDLARAASGSSASSEGAAAGHPAVSHRPSAPLRAGRTCGPRPLLLLALLFVTGAHAAPALTEMADRQDQEQRRQALQVVEQTSPRVLGSLIGYLLGGCQIELRGSLTAELAIDCPVLAARARTELAGALRANPSVAQLALQWLKLNGPAGLILPLAASALTDEHLAQLAQLAPPQLDQFLLWLSRQAPEMVGQVAQKVVRAAGAASLELGLVLARKHPQAAARAVGYAARYCPSLLPRLMRLLVRRGPVSL